MYKSVQNEDDDGTKIEGILGHVDFPAGFQTSETGLAPFHGNTCDSCHVRNGSGIPLMPNGKLSQIHVGRGMKPDYHVKNDYTCQIKAADLCSTTRDRPKKVHPSEWPSSCADVSGRKINEVIKGGDIGFMHLLGRRLGNTPLIELIPDAEIRAARKEQAKTSVPGCISLAPGTRWGTPIFPPPFDYLAYNYVIKKIAFEYDDNMLPDEERRHLKELEILGEDGKVKYPFVSYLGTDLLMHDMGYLSQVASAPARAKIRKRDGRINPNTMPRQRALNRGILRLGRAPTQRGRLRQLHGMPALRRKQTFFPTQSIPTKGQKTN